MKSQNCVHNFIPSKVREKIFYCPNCGILSTNTFQLSKPYEFNAKTELDPLVYIASLLNTENKDPLNESNSKISTFILTLRTEGIKIIKNLINKFELDEQIFHSSIYIFDYLLIKKNVKIPIHFLSPSCLIITTKFNGLIEKAIELENYLFKNNPNTDNKNLYKVIEFEILRQMNYLLSFNTSYDILYYLMCNGIIFEDEIKGINININLIYLNCFMQINQLIEKNLSLKYNTIQLAFAVIFLIRCVYGLENRQEVFEYIYNYPFRNYEKCFKFLISKVKISKINGSVIDRTNNQNLNKVADK